MKIRHPILIRSLAFVASWILKLWMGTLRLRIHNEDGQKHPADVRKNRFVYAFWHNSLLGMLPHPTRVYVLISHHADGEIIARICSHLRVGVVRGSTSRRAIEGLLGLARCAEKGHLGITPDGPRGPRHRVQPGVVQLASLTGLPIIPVGFGFVDAWRFRSWDRFCLPKPYSTVTGVTGKPIHVPKKLTREQLEEYRLLVEQELNRLTERAEVWAESGNRQPPIPVNEVAHEQSLSA